MSEWNILETAKAMQPQLKEHYDIEMTLPECIVMAVLRENEIIPAPLTYYEEDKALIRGLAEISKKIIKNMKKYLIVECS